MPKNSIRCDRCNTKIIDEQYGYGIVKDEKYCYRCCGEIELAEMIKTGLATLYFDNNTVSNWPGTLKFTPINVRKSRHNIARNRYDVWFKDMFDHIWHGVQYGDNTQLLHCKRTKN